MPSQESELATAVITSTASVSGLLEACCGLLLIPAPSPSLFTPNLERVLLKLGLHNRELGLKQINTLLRNGAAAFLQGMCISLNPVDSVTYGTVFQVVAVVMPFSLRGGSPTRVRSNMNQKTVIVFSHVSRLSLLRHCSFSASHKMEH